MRSHAVLALAAAMGMLPASVQAGPSVADQLEQERRRLGELQDELERVKRRRDVVHVKERSTAERLKEAEQELAVNDQRLRVATLRIAQQDEEIANATLTLSTLQDHAVVAREKARERVRELAKWTATDYARVLIPARPETAVRQYDFLRLVLEGDRRPLRNAHDATVAVEQQVAVLEELRRELERSRREQQQARRAVLREREKHKRLLRTLRAEKVAYTRSIKDLEEASRRLESLIDQLSRRVPFRGNGLAQQRGRLPWPSTGAVVGEFGRYRHPRFDTYIERKGIEIELGAGEPIRSIGEGRVAFAGPIDGYGLVVIVDHGAQYFSLYARAAGLRVRAGDMITAGQVIGTAGRNTETDRLYFELRHGQNALDPSSWLVQRGG